MEEDKLKNMFDGFDPKLSSDFDFMKRLERKLDTVEMVKQHNEAFRTRSRKAVVIAALVGFVVGFLSSLALPYIGEMVAGFKLSLPSRGIVFTLADHYLIVSWMIIATVSVLMAVGAYELSFSLSKGKR